MDTEIPTETGYTREDVMAAFRAFIDAGVTSPDALDLNDPQVVEANRIHEAWIAQEDAHAAELGTREAFHLANLAKTTILVDAGFSDPSYLEEIAGDQLEQDLDNVNAEGLTEVAGQIQAEIDKIQGKLEKSP